MVIGALLNPPDVVIVLLLSDGIMCGLTAVSWVIQRLVHSRVLDWDRSGWVVQNVCGRNPHLIS